MYNNKNEIEILYVLLAIFFGMATIFVTQYIQNRKERKWLKDTDKILKHLQDIEKNNP